MIILKKDSISKNSKIKLNEKIKKEKSKGFDRKEDMLESNKVEYTSGKKKYYYELKLDNLTTNKEEKQEKLFEFHKPDHKKSNNNKLIL